MYLESMIFNKNKTKGLIRRDAANIIQHGFSAPRYAERIWINPSQVKFLLRGKDIVDDGKNRNRELSGFVFHGKWPHKKVILVEEGKKISCCLSHWVDGVPWEETGIFEHMLYLIKERGTHDGCTNLADIKERYQKLDKIFEETKKLGRLKTRKELKKNSFREEGGIYIHIGPQGKPYFGQGGHHRFSIAKVLNIPFPAQVGIVHVDAISSLREFRYSGSHPGEVQ